ncbi:MAG: hypothetical protein ACRCTG_15420 [Aestuariivirga sp.]
MKATREEMSAFRQEVNDRNDRIEKALGTIIENQRAGAADREQMKADISDMKPHVKTVAAAKTFWTVAGWVSATLGAIAGAFYGLWLFVQPYIKFPWGR